MFLYFVRVGARGDSGSRVGFYISSGILYVVYIYFRGLRLVFSFGRMGVGGVVELGLDNILDIEESGLFFFFIDEKTEVRVRVLFDLRVEED